MSDSLDNYLYSKGLFQPSAEDEYFASLEEPVDNSWIDYSLLCLELHQDEAHFLSYLKLGYNIKESAGMAGRKPEWGRTVLHRIRQEIESPRDFG